MEFALEALVINPFNSFYPANLENSSFCVFYSVEDWTEVRDLMEVTIENGNRDVCKYAVKALEKRKLIPWEVKSCKYPLT